MRSRRSFTRCSNQFLKVNRRPPVVIVHGLWMGAWQMRALKLALVRGGERAYRFHYPSTRRAFADNQAELARWIEARIGASVQLIGHSLGGLLALELARARPDLCAGKLICLGTPLGPARAIADGEQRAPWAQPLLGYARAPLLAQAQPPAASVQTYMLAGTRSFGGGRLLTRFNEPNDGSVALSETRADWLSAHLTLPLTHTGLALRRSASAQVLDWLRESPSIHAAQRSVHAM
jgi:pimeloyl-ACP methyl ester carboxylesterase